MRKLFLFLVVLFLSFQQVTLAAIKEMTSTPDSVYLFSFATSGDDGRSGLRFAWSMDKENWFEVGRNYGYLRCDYSRWGSQKKMLDPYLKQSPAGEWICTWKLNDRDGYGQATSKDLINWTSQKYPRTTSDFNGTRVKAVVAGEEQKGTINRVAWTLVDGLNKNYGWNQYRNSLHGERPVQDGERFAGLKPVKATVTVQPEGAKAISDVLLGAFFEDINYSADGGLYAELIQNRDFEYDPSDREGDKNWNSTHSWALKGEKTTFTIDTTDPIHINNPHYAVLNVEQPGAALENTGFDGIALNTGEKYDFSIFARVPQGKSNKLQVRLVDGKGNVCGETSLTVSSRQWKTYKAVITAKATADTHLEIIPQSVGELNLDMISLFPQNTFKGRKNGLRKDLAQVLADIHPRFIRFPGGCVAHGDGLKNIYQWKNTVGPLEARKAQRNLWGYHQSMGLGYFEYFQFCEDIGAEPLPVLAAGVPCQNSACHGDLRGGQQGGIPMSEMGAYIQDILDLIEWANGDAKKTKWGKVRAEAGHPKPFNLKYIGIGNEDLITDIFEERFTMIFNAIKEKYPDCAVTLSIGEKSKESYKRYFDAGADRYLLRHETADEAHYKKLHPEEMSLAHRKQCLWDLKEIGYQVGCGFMVGSPGQTVETLYEDLQFIRELQPHMVGIGPFISQKDTPFADKASGTMEQTLKLLAIIRLIHPHVLLPATTALGTIHPKGRELGILSGANVVMPNLSPVNVREKYKLYDNKICTGNEAAECRYCMENRMKSIGYEVAVSRGDYIE